jgi:hypothetical protein
MKSDDFLTKRKLFAKDIGAPSLYDYVDHFGLYAGLHTIGNKLWTYELFKKTVGTPGDIYEFGSWKGSNLMFLAKLNFLFEPASTKKIISFDNFSGLPDPSSEDGKYATSQTGKYNGNEEILRQAIDLFSLNEKVQLVVGDGRDTIPKYEKENPQNICSFAYLDFDLYEPTKVALKFLDNNISVGGIIVFDQACTEQWPGETLAMKEYLNETKHNFEMLSNTISRQPTVAIKRVS